MSNIMFVSLGCDKNSVDSEFMLGELCAHGYNIVNDFCDADIAVINTCSFISDAKRESINTILEAAEYKKTGKLKKLVVTGCLAQRYYKEIKEQIPEADIIIGTTAIDKIVDAIEQETDFVEDINRLPLPETQRISTTGGFYSYLKIAEGCDKRCTYCVIPYVRGRYRSIPLERLIEEAKYLASLGTKELIIVAQETTLYGTDLYGKKMLPELIRSLEQIDGIKWIRLMYCYPEEIDDEFVNMFVTSKKLCHYIDLPIQSASDEILRRMGRRTNSSEIRNIIDKLKKAIPDIVIRTSLIAGFPGETDEDFEDTVNFVKDVKFQRLGCFTYSKEENTPAAKFKNQIPERIKKKRRNEIMKLQQEISAEHNRQLIGKDMDVMIEGRLPEDNIWIGRSYMDAPGVDGYVFVNSDREYISGDIIRVKITDAKEYDLVGTAL